MSYFQDMNDYELVSLAQEMDEDAKVLLHQKYQPLIGKKSRKFYPYLKNKGVELSDLVQECTIGFEEAIHHFNPMDHVSFYTFANVCMDRQLMSEVSRLNRNKHKFLNEAIPLEVLENEEHQHNLIDFIQDNTNNPEVGLMFHEEFRELYEKIVKELTDLEECVFKLKIQDFSYREIAMILDKDEKSIDNAIQRIKNKIRAIRN